MKAIVEAKRDCDLHEAVLREIRSLQESNEVWGHGTSLDIAMVVNLAGFETHYGSLNRTAGFLPEDPTLLRMVLEEWPFSDFPEAIVLIIVPKTEGVDYSKWNSNYGWCIDHQKYMSRDSERGIYVLKGKHLYGYIDMKTGRIIKPEPESIFS